MDRSYLKEDTVKVFPTITKHSRDQEAVATFQAKPYSSFGLDLYVYRNTAYPAYVMDDMTPCIFLDKPRIQSTPRKAA